jgi:hypothetical protein
VTVSANWASVYGSTSIISVPVLTSATTTIDFGLSRLAIYVAASPEKRFFFLHDHVDGSCSAHMRGEMSLEEVGVAFDAKCNILDCLGSPTKQLRFRFKFPPSERL